MAYCWFSGAASTSSRAFEIAVISASATSTVGPRFQYFASGVWKLLSSWQTVAELVIEPSTSPYDPSV